MRPEPKDTERRQPVRGFHEWRAVFLLLAGLLTLSLLILGPARQTLTLRDYASYHPSSTVLARYGRGVIHDAALSADRHWLAIGTGIGVYLHDAHTLDSVGFIPTPYPVTSVDFSSEGRHIVAGLSDGRLLIVDREQGSIIHTLEGQGSGISATAWSGDGRWIASAESDGPILLWDAGTFEVIHRLWIWESGLFNPVSLAFSPDGGTLAGGFVDGTVILWDVEQGERRVTHRAHGGLTRALAWTPDGAKLASTGGDSRVMFWAGPDAERDGEWFDFPARSLAYSPDGRWLLVGLEGGIVRLWDTESGSQTTTFHLDSGPVIDLFWTDEGRMISVSEDGGLIRWDTRSGRAVRRFEGYTARPLRLEIDSAGRITTLDSSGRLWAWNGESGTPTLIQDFEHVLIPFHPPEDSKGALSARAREDHTVVIIRLGSGEIVTILRGHIDRIQDLAFSPDESRLATASMDRTVRLWDVETGTEIATYAGHADRVDRIAWGPDGRWIASISPDGTVIVWGIEICGREQDALC